MTSNPADTRTLVMRHCADLADCIIKVGLRDLPGGAGTEVFKDGALICTVGKYVGRVTIRRPAKPGSSRKVSHQGKERTLWWVEGARRSDKRLDEYASRADAIRVVLPMFCDDAANQQ